MSRIWAKLVGMLCNRSLVGVDKTGNRYFTRREEIDGFMKEKRFVVFKGEHDPTSIPVEWICWLNGQRKNAPTSEEMAELEARRELLKLNVARLKEEEETLAKQGKFKTTRVSKLAGPDLKSYARQFTDAYEGDAAAEPSNAEDETRSSEPSGSGESFRPGTWQPPNLLLKSFKMTNLVFGDMKLFFAIITLACLWSFVLPDAQGDALYALKESLNASTIQLPNWDRNQVDPCTWFKIRCDDYKNVTMVLLSNMGFSGTISPALGVLKRLNTLSLQGNGITGKIPDELGNLASLEMLNLENNQLSGEIPSSLGNLKNLKSLSLSNNNLIGTIPQSFSHLSILTDIQLASNDLNGQIPENLFQAYNYNFTGNHLNCGFRFSHHCEPDREDVPKKSKTGMIVGIVCGFIVVLLGSLLYLWRDRCNSYRHDVFVDVPGEVDRGIDFDQLKRFVYTELQVATDYFNEKNVLGQGGFGKVYKGVLSDNTKIAVKRLTDYKSPGGDAAFLREVEMISVAFHRNILGLIGFCTTPTERLLVYPFMENLSVAYRLREFKAGESVLDWPTRKKVALGTARGLEYLHEHCNPRIIHRDVKAANVLLDKDFEAVVGDFGLAKLVDIRQTNVLTQVRGTMGHIAPEYLSTGKSSQKTDVFGYGIMLLELVTGQRAIEFSRLEEEEDVLLLDHVKKLQREKMLSAIVDRNLEDYDIQEVEMMIQMALLCTQASPEDRPMMSSVVRMLEGESLAGGRWEEWQHIEATGSRQEYYERCRGAANSCYNQEAMQLSGGR